MRRREFSGLCAGAALWLRAASAQGPAIPRVGLLRPTPAAPFAELVAALLQGLREEGLEAGRDFILQQRWADNLPDRVPALADELVALRVAVIIGSRGTISVARSATSTIPLVFVSTDAKGLVENLSRPEGNITGVTFYGGSVLNAKQLEILRDLAPAARIVGVLADANYLPFEAGLADLLAVGRALGLELVLDTVAGASEFDAAFGRFRQAGAGAVLVSGSPTFTSERKTLIALAARHALPAIYDQRAFVLDGGLVSYGASFNDAYRQAGTYAGRILQGATPAELPVLQPTTFTLALNLGTARAAGIEVPPALLLRANELIEQAAMVERLPWRRAVGRRFSTTWRHLIA